MRKVLKNNMQMLEYIWKSDKKIFFIALLFCSCSLLSPLQDTYLPKLIIDKLGDKASFINILPIISIFCGIAVYKAILYPLYRQYALPIASNKVAKTMNEMVIQKTRELDLECYENKKFFDEYTRSLKEADTRAIEVFSSFVDFLKYLSYMGVLAGIIFTLSPILLIVGIISALFMLFFSRLLAQQQYNYSNERIEFERECDYPKRVLYQPEYSKETRFYSITSILEKNILFMLQS